MQFNIYFKILKIQPFSRRSHDRFQQAQCWMINSQLTVKIIHWKLSWIGSWNKWISCINIIYRSIWVIYEYIFNPHIHRLPVGLIAQLVKRCTGVAKVRVQVPIKPNVYRPYPLLLSVDNCEDYTLKIYYYLRAILCKNQTKWEMKNFEPPTQI